MFLQARFRQNEHCHTGSAVPPCLWPRVLDIVRAMSKLGNTERLDSRRGSFPTTRWSEVSRGANWDTREGQAALGSVFSRYRRPLMGYLQRRFGCSPEAAEDLLHGFAEKKLLEHHLLAVADPEKGRFRTFLLAALNSFVISRYRQDQAARRNPPGGLHSLDADGGDIHHPAVGPATSSFDVDWARAGIEAALTGMREECERTQRLDVWEVFRARMLEPLLHDTHPVSYESLARQHGLRSVKAAQDLLTTAKRMFARHLHRVVGETVSDPDLVLSEIHEIRTILAEGQDTIPGISTQNRVSQCVENRG